MEEKNNEIKECTETEQMISSEQPSEIPCTEPASETTIEEIITENAEVTEEIPSEQITEETKPEIDPEILAKQKAEEEAKKKKTKKKIAIYSVIGALVLVIGIILISVLSAERISFDKETANAYDAYGLTCYSPDGWTVREGTNEYDADITGSYYYNKDNEIAAYVGVQYLGEFDKFSDVMNEAKENDVPIDYFIKDKTKATASLSNNVGWQFYTMIILCDRSGFLISGGANEKLYKEDVLKEIIDAIDFDSYSSKGICEYLGGHEFADEDAWTETLAATCTEPGTEENECTVCLQTIERETELAPHTVEGGETVESTCTEAGTVSGTCSVCEAEVVEELPLAEHTTGDWIVDKEATETTEGERHKECTVCGKEMESESFTLTLDEIKATYNTGITYNQLSRDPDTYEGEKVKFRGRVLQVIEGDYTTALRVATSGRWDNVIYVEYAKGFVESRVLEDDTITIYGKSKGLMSYKSTGSGTITIPSISVDYIDQ